MKPGFHVMPAAQYHADCCDDPSLSNSLLQVILRESPLKAWHCHPKLNKDYQHEDSDRFDLGTAGHAVVLQDDTSGIVVVDADDWRKKEAREQREAARAKGKTPLLAKHNDAVLRMVGAAHDFIAGSEIDAAWHDADSELVAVWREGPLWMRCMFDKLTKDRRDIIDYKTTDNASPEPFSRLLVRMGYHIQDAFYRRGVRALCGHDPRFRFLAQSVEVPHECSLHACDPSLQTIADAEVERGIGIWRECITKDFWPSYGKRVHYALPTNYMIVEHEARLIEAETA